MERRKRARESVALSRIFLSRLKINSGVPSTISTPKRTAGSKLPYKGSFRKVRHLGDLNLESFLNRTRDGSCREKSMMNYEALLVIGMQSKRFKLDSS